MVGSLRAGGVRADVLVRGGKEVFELGGGYGDGESGRKGWGKNEGWGVTLVAESWEA